MFKVFFRTLLGLFFAVLAFIVISKTFPLPGTVPVLMYHSIGARQNAREAKNFVSRGSFKAQMMFLHYFGYHVIAMRDYEASVNGRRKPGAREVLITFDDGNRTFEQEAWPLLKKYSFPVTLFLVSESVKRQLNNSMPEKTIRQLLKSGQVTLGSNSKTHPFLPSVNEVQMENEIAGSKKDLEERFKVPVDYFSYPNGDLDGRALSAVKKAGYRLAFTTSYHKLGTLEETPLSITRLNISRSADNPFVFWIKITGIYQVHKHYWHQFKIWLKGLRPSPQS